MVTRGKEAPQGPHRRGTHPHLPNRQSPPSGQCPHPSRTLHLSYRPHFSGSGTVSGGSQGGESWGTELRSEPEGARPRPRALPPPPAAPAGCRLDMRTRWRGSGRWEAGRRACSFPPPGAGAGRSRRALREAGRSWAGSRTRELGARLQRRRRTSAGVGGRSCAPASPERSVQGMRAARSRRAAEPGELRQQ